MSGSEALFTAALGLSWPWRVTDIRFEPEAGEIHFDIGRSSPRLSCPTCGASDQPIHDRREHAWHHLHFFQYRAFIHAPLPRVRCGVPAARPRSLRCRGRGRASVLRCCSKRWCRAWPKRCRRRRWPVCVDQKHIGRLGFISLSHDAGPARRVLFGTAGKDASVFEAFTADLIAHGGDPQAISAVSMDWSRAFKAGAAKHLPQALPCFDRFPLIKLANEAVEAVRRSEVKSQPALKGKRWGTLKDHRRWTRAQIDDMHWLTHSNLKTARAWRLKEALRAIFETAKDGMDPEPALKRWVSWARRCRLAPFKRLGATVRDHLPGILDSFRLGLSNGTAESINAKVQAAIARARGFRTHRHLMTVIYLTCGKLTHLPAPPYTRPISAV